MSNLGVGHATGRHGSEGTIDPLPESASLLMDIIRFGLCLLVLIGHSTQTYFQQGWPELMWLADGAVPGFFVLSGFVIRYVTTTRERDGRRYWVSRASRIYSVVIPAIILTILLDLISRSANYSYYSSVVPPQPWHTVPYRTLVNLLFMTQSWGHAGVLLTDTPFWSLGYEVPYYVFFGIVTFTRGSLRLVLLIGASLAVGPQVLFLMPIWWSGIWLYDLWQWVRQPGTGTRARLLLPAIMIGLLMWLLLPVSGNDGMHLIERVPNLLALLHQPPLRAGMTKYSVGFLSFCLLFLLLSASDLVKIPKRTLAARAVRKVAEGTFTLYLFHFPMLVCAAALHLYRRDQSADKVVLLSTVTMTCVVASMPVAKFKDWLRSRLFEVRF